MTYESKKMVIPDVLGIKTLLKKIDEHLFHRQDKALQDLLQSTNMDFVAQVLETLPRGRKKTFNMLESDKAAQVLKKLSPYLRRYVLAETKPEKILSISNFLESDEIADIIKILPLLTREQVIAELKKYDPKHVLRLLKLRSDTAGGLMKTELVVGKQDLSVREFIEYLQKDYADSFPKTSYVYLVDQNGKWEGSFNFNKLYLANPKTKLREIASKRYKPVNIDEDQEEVARHFDAMEAQELPVVDKNGAIVGRISADDIIDVMRTEFSEDIYRLVGVFANERADDPYRLKIRRRFPWLLVNLGTAILAAFTVSLFTDTIASFVILAAYMPIIAGMGGNAATQTLGVTIRAIALDEITELNTWRIIFKEIFTGMFNGAGTGLIMGIIAYLFNHNLTLSVVIFTAMTINLFIAGLGGSIIPLIMKWLKIDPALASTVFVTTLTDVFGFLSFLGLATILLK